MSNLDDPCSQSWGGQGRGSLMNSMMIQMTVSLSLSVHHTCKIHNQGQRKSLDNHPPHWDWRNLKYHHQLLPKNWKRPRNILGPLGKRLGPIWCHPSSPITQGPSMVKATCSQFSWNDIDRIIRAIIKSVFFGIFIKFPWQTKNDFFGFLFC